MSLGFKNKKFLFKNVFELLLTLYWAKPIINLIMIIN